MIVRRLEDLKGEAHDTWSCKQQWRVFAWKSACADNTAVEIVGISSSR
jgi:hypothetical protein